MTEIDISDIGWSHNDLCLSPSPGPSGVLV
jgi:hypothetical protein